MEDHVKALEDARKREEDLRAELDTAKKASDEQKQELADAKKATEDLEKKEKERLDAAKQKDEAERKTLADKMVERIFKDKKEEQACKDFAKFCEKLDQDDLRYLDGVLEFAVVRDNKFVIPAKEAEGKSDTADKFMTDAKKAEDAAIAKSRGEKQPEAV